MSKQEMIEIVIPENTLSVRDCQYCPHHHCYMTADGLECSCDFGTNTQTQGIPLDCTLRSLTNGD